MGDDQLANIIGGLVAASNLQTFQIARETALMYLVSYKQSVN